MATQGVWECTNEEYHADHKWIGSTMLKSFLSPGPLTYHAWYVAHTQTPPPPTFDMIFGTAVHLLVLEEAGVFSERVAVIPGGYSRKPARKVEKSMVDAFIETHPDHIILSQAEHDKVVAMAASVAQNPFAAALLRQPYKTEHTIRWVDPATGLGCKCRFDLLIPKPLLVGDLKTAEDPLLGPFMTQAARLQYHISAAHYSSGAACVYDGDGRVPWHFIAVGKHEPYETHVHHYTPADMEWAEGLYSRTMAQLKACYDFNDWHPNGYGKSNSGRIPGWAKNAS